MAEHESIVPRVVRISERMLRLFFFSFLSNLLSYLCWLTHGREDIAIARWVAEAFALEENPTSSPIAE